MNRSVMTTSPASSAGRSTSCTCWARSAAYSSASARDERPALAGSSTIARIRPPSGVPPGSRVARATTPPPVGPPRRLEGVPGDPALLGEPLLQPAHLGGLTRALATLEGDEHPAAGQPPPGR